MTDSEDESGSHLKHWQECEMPECRNDVPKSTAICDECVGVGRYD